jgi:hypothetical protein
MNVNICRGFGCRIMNDATLRQMAAAKTMVNNDIHMARALIGRFRTLVCSTPIKAPPVKSRGVVRSQLFSCTAQPK